MKRTFLKCTALLAALLMILTLAAACASKKTSTDGGSAAASEGSDSSQNPSTEKEPPNWWETSAESVTPSGESVTPSDGETVDPAPVDNVIRVWVGEESVDFYQFLCNLYVNAHSDFGYKIEVKGMDTGIVAGTIANDPQAAADIFTVAHDNIGIIAANQWAKPIADQSLIDQVTADNPQSYKNVIYSTLNDKEYLYGVPYISQALFLYYNKSLVTEEQAKTFEGLREAAAAAGTKAVTVTGDDGFNMSFALLATKVSDHSTTVKIYEGADSVVGGSKGTSYCQGDDTIAIYRWLQDYAADPNGFTWASSAGWEADLNYKGVVAVIGGAWYYNSAKASVGGEDNLGIAPIPTFTLTEKSVEGLTGVSAGDVYRGGTFADCKCFMINALSAPEKYEKEQELIKFLSNKDTQNSSFNECGNVPAYVGADAYIKQLYESGYITETEYKLAMAQVEMAQWGIPQPFKTGTLNTYYYSKNAPAVLRAIIDKSGYPRTGVEETESLAGIRKALYLVEYIWMHGQAPKEFPATYPEKA